MGRGNENERACRPQRGGGRPANLGKETSRPRSRSWVPVWRQVASARGRWGYPIGQFLPVTHRVALATGSAIAFPPNLGSADTEPRVSLPHEQSPSMAPHPRMMREAFGGEVTDKGGVTSS